MNDPLIRVMLQMKWQQNTDKITHHRDIYIKQINAKWALWWTLTEKRGRQLLGWKRSIFSRNSPPRKQELQWLKRIESVQDVAQEGHTNYNTATWCSTGL